MAHIREEQQAMEMILRKSFWNRLFARTTAWIMTMLEVGRNL
jgi:hypothetical protein